MKHLDRNRWMWRTVNGWKLKRVSAEGEAQFPRKYREALRDYGAPRVVKMLMEDKGASMSDAWAMLKTMCNTKRGVLTSLGKE